MITPNQPSTHIHPNPLPPSGVPEGVPGAVNLLNQVHVASPCGESWEAMPGGDKVRSCARCQHKVYNLSEMTSLEAAALIEKAEGRLCVRFYRRADGTMMTKDCPVGARLKRRRIARAGGLGFTALAVACGAGLTSKPRAEQPSFLRWVMNHIQPEPEPQATAGAISFRPLPMASPTPRTPRPVATPRPEMGEAVAVMGAPRPIVMGKIRVVPHK